MDTASINSITRLRIHSDGEGVRSVIFLQGCPLDCFWCCNPETRFGKEYRTLTAQQLYSYIREDIPYFLFSGGGVTFSGGEPLLQADFIKAFADDYCRDFTVDLETSLYAPWEVIEPLVPRINLWNVDFKIFREAKHMEYTGKSNALILQNLRRLVREAGAEKVLITYPLIPGINDSREAIRDMMTVLKENGIRKVEVHPYRKFAENKHRKLDKPCREIPEVTPRQHRKVLDLLRSNGFTTVQRATIYSKEKCAYLKGLRRAICEKWELDVEIMDCHVTEDCIGTCPRCELELHRISLQKNQKTNRAV